MFTNIYVFILQLAVFKDQNSQLLEEFAGLSQQLTESQEEYNQLEHHLNRLLGESIALENVSIEECEEIEKTLKNALQKIDAKKVCMYVILWCSSIIYCYNIDIICFECIYIQYRHYSISIGMIYFDLISLIYTYSVFLFILYL